MTETPVRVAAELIGTWAAILAGDLLIWTLHAFSQPEPTQTYSLNFIESNVEFLATLAIGGAILTTIGLELARYYRWFMQ